VKSLPRFLKSFAPVRYLLVALGACMIAAGLIEWWFARERQHRYDRLIILVARNYGVNPALVKAVVWQESKFDAKARGRAGEIGLMQIGQLAAHEWAAEETRRPAFEGNLFDPVTNLQIGTWYLSKLLRRYSGTDNPVAYALADYNAGRTHVLRWNHGSAATNSATFIKQITFPGTQSYVQSVITQAERYQAEFRPATK
jgi:soluble lytic murein transglycosylase